jgi:hypothetical protein
MVASKVKWTLPEKFAFHFRNYRPEWDSQGLETWMRTEELPSYNWGHPVRLSFTCKSHEFITQLSARLLL